MKNGKKYKGKALDYLLVAAISVPTGLAINKYVVKPIQNEIGNPKEEYIRFPFPNEIPGIMKHAERVGVEPELLMAIRTAENGGPGREYGVLRDSMSEEMREQYDNDEGYRIGSRYFDYDNLQEKQLSWAAWTVKKNRERFKNQDKSKDFISFLKGKYAPDGVKNDPRKLNNNWEKNVKHFYDNYKKLKLDR